MELCNEHGLKAVALADHNSIGGLTEAQEAANRFEIETIGSDFHGKIKPSIKLGSRHCQEEADIYYQFKKKLIEIGG